MNVEEKILSLGGKLEIGGINWTWATFRKEKSATAFNSWCEANGLETRGVYAPTKEAKGWSVRFR